MIYLDNAATTFPKPKVVIEDMLECMSEYCANPGRGAHDMSLKCEMKIMECRNNLAKLFNISNPMNIVFTNNTTEGLNIALNGLLKPGDHVITTEIEHNSVLRPLAHLKDKGVEVTVLPIDSKGYISIDKLKNAFKKNTKLVEVIHGSNVIGTIQDLDKINHIVKEREVIFMVDAAQTAGVVDIDVKKYNIDILAFPGHKGLLGPQGTGGLYLSNGKIIDFFKTGGTGSVSNLVTQPDFLPDKFESGTLNTPGIVGLNSSVKFILDKGIENIRNHESKLIEYATEELKKFPNINLLGELNATLKAPIISFNVEGVDSSDVGVMLNSKGICVRTGYHCAALVHKALGTTYKGTVRISPGYFNTFKDIDKLLKVLRDLYI